MRLTRTPDGKGKYAIVRLDKLSLMDDHEKRMFHSLLNVMETYELLEYGERNSDDEFFVIKLKDRFSGAALRAYANDAGSDPEYREEILKLADRAENHPNSKRPD